MMRAARIATTFLPPLLAALLAITAAGGELHVAGIVLLEVWIVMAGTLLLRAMRSGRARWSEELDLLTATGRTTSWSALAAVLLAMYTGWASLSVVGILGLGLVCLATTWTAVVAGGDEPWRRASITRTILPELATEDEPHREEVRIEGIKIPVGMRLFATGRSSKHGVTTRYAVGGEGNSAQIELTSDLGPAPRGEHHVPAMLLWLGDVLGLTRTRIHRSGETSFRVLPRPARVDGVRELLGERSDAMITKPALRMPTEGTFRIREYAPGDDTRRIHWVRSLQANQLIVRLPDEIPPADPTVRLVLDNYFSGITKLSCRAPAELLDAMVRVWLGIAKALTDAGVRVTLVTSVERDGVFTRAERPMLGRGGDAARFGARVTWQSEIELHTLLDQKGRSDAARQVIVSCRPRRLDHASGNRASGHAWVVVPHNGWTSPEPWPAPKTAIMLPFPAGSAENRLGHRKREHLRVVAGWNDRTLFSGLCWIDWKAYSGELVARPKRGGVELQVIP